MPRKMKVAPAKPMTLEEQVAAQAEEIRRLKGQIEVSEATQTRKVVFCNEGPDDMRRRQIEEAGGTFLTAEDRANGWKRHLARERLRKQAQVQMVVSAPQGAEEALEMPPAAPAAPAKPAGKAPAAPAKSAAPAKGGAPADDSIPGA